MREVMMKAQELAEAILTSDACREVQRLEEEAGRDPAATAAAAVVFEKKQRVERIIAESRDAEAIRAAAEELEQARLSMNDIPVVAELKKAREEFDRMMENVNRILRLVVTGETVPEEGACSGDCANCGGCH